ncbi:ORF415 [White spot syndrome virus]|uniref:Wsv378 n=3 Tax=White spot syndrome virus TaxID=342409 RepID=Q8VAM3_WSSVS|nr:wsv378 [Shrimp white spot syndrome virus]AFX59755.1 wsv378 [White spot syndrome virus]AAL33380.1 wsv378 [Shrimp white spot syndrome virus]AAL89305.1 WSSV437 [Shrimp white spot syndrome virus]ATU84139.1 ORF415 [White spot syndrome virus]AWQ60503.1 wsv378 [Shrimp white spot syndrome virus]
MYHSPHAPAALSPLISFCQREIHSKKRTPNKVQQLPYPLPILPLLTLLFVSIWLEFSKPSLSK